MLEKCPHCEADVQLLPYKGLKPNIGIFFDPPRYIFCPKCGQIFKWSWPDKVAPEWDWCVPHKTVWKKQPAEEE